MQFKQSPVFRPRLGSAGCVLDLRSRGKSQSCHLPFPKLRNQAVQIKSKSREEPCARAKNLGASGDSGCPRAQGWGTPHSCRDAPACTAPHPHFPPAPFAKCPFSAPNPCGEEKLRISRSGKQGWGCSYPKGMPVVPRAQLPRTQLPWQAASLGAAVLPVPGGSRTGRVSADPAKGSCGCPCPCGCHCPYGCHCPCSCPGFVLPEQWPG